LNPSLSSVENRLVFLADIDLLEKQESPDFPYVEDSELFKSFNLPEDISLKDLSTGTLLHKLASNEQVRPSSRWWDFAVNAIEKAGEADAAPCAAEIYLARVAQMHIDAGEAQLDYIEGRPAGNWIVGEQEESSEVEKAITAPPTVTGGSAPAATSAYVPQTKPVPDAGTGEDLFKPVGGDGPLQTLTDTPDSEASLVAGGQVQDAGGGSMATIDVPDASTIDPGSIPEVEYKGEDTEFDDNIVGQPMDGLGLSDDESKAGDVKEVLDKINGYSQTLLEIVDSEEELDFWILDKISRMGSDISDIKHYLEYHKEEQDSEIEKGLDHEHK